MRYFDEHRRRIKKHDFIRGYLKNISSENNILSLPDCAGVPLKNLEIKGNTKQESGTATILHPPISEIVDLNYTGGQFIEYYVTTSQFNVIEEFAQTKNYTGNWKLTLKVKNSEELPSGFAVMVGDSLDNVLTGSNCTILYYNSNNSNDGYITLNYDSSEMYIGIGNVDDGLNGDTNYNTYFSEHCTFQLQPMEYYIDVSYPSPEKPSEIISVGDNGTKITIHGTNLLPDYAWSVYSPPYYQSITWSTYKNKVVYLKEGTYRISAKYTSPYARTQFVAFDEESHGRVVKKAGSGDTVTENYTIGNGYVNIYGIAQSSSNQPSGNTFLTITVKKPIYVHFWFSPRATTSTDGNSAADKQYTAYNCMLVEGTKVLPYETYVKPQSITLPSNYHFAKIGDYADEIVISKGQVKYIQRIYKKVLTGNENWWILNQASGGVTRQYFITELLPNGNNTYNTQRAICTHLKTGAWNPFTTDNTFAIADIHLYVGMFDIPALSDFKAYLNEQYENGTPVTIYYILNNPIETDITSEINNLGEFLKTGYDTNESVCVESALQPSGIKCKYYSLSENQGGQNEL